MLVRLSVALAGAALIAAMPAIAKEKVRPAPAGDIVSCEGVYGPASSEALLIDTFGAANVQTGIVYGPEGSEILATTIFPDDPDRAVQFVWFDEDNRTHASTISLSPAQTGPGGVRIGQSVAEVEKLNGYAFEVGGFWWDYGGYANIDQGAFAGKLEGGCYLSIRFAPKDDYPEDRDVTAVSGEVQIPSGEPLLEQLDTRVQVLSIAYPWPDDLPRPQY